MTRQQTTHRATKGYDSPVTCFVRDEAGPLDLTGKALSVNVRHYGHTRTRMTLAATQSEPGEVQFTFPIQDRYFSYDSLYRFTVTADGLPVYDALLEVI